MNEGETVDPFSAMERRRADQARTSENAARTAQVFATYTTVGAGEFRDPELVDFGISFVEEPYVSHGYSMNDDDLLDTRFPRAWGFVVRWLQTSQGYYIGAWVATLVETTSANISTTLPEPGYSIDHNFTFTGNAMKDVPEYILED